jgi:hypothetical protein
MAILKLMEAGQLTLDDKVVDRLAHLLPAGGVTDTRWNQVTLRNLLQHSLGWDRAVGGEPMQNSIAISLALGIRGPATSSTSPVVFQQPLHFQPVAITYTGSPTGCCRGRRAVSGCLREKYARGGAGDGIRPDARRARRRACRSPRCEPPRVGVFRPGFGDHRGQLFHA